MNDYPMADAARLLGTDTLRLTCYELWMEATPEASIIRTGSATVVIEAANERSQP